MLQASITSRQSLAAEAQTKELAGIATKSGARLGDEIEYHTARKKRWACDAVVTLYRIKVGCKSTHPAHGEREAS
jgi:hypothetical protein